MPAKGGNRGRVRGEKTSARDLCQERITAKNGKQTYSWVELWAWKLNYLGKLVAKISLWGASEEYEKTSR